MQTDALENVVLLIIISIIMLFAIALMTQNGNVMINNTFKDPTAFFTMLLAVFTMLLAIVTVFIWTDARNNFVEQRDVLAAQSKLTENALEISRTSAQAAIKAVENAEHRTKIELRAYVSVTVVNIHLTIRDDLRALLTADIVLTNGGKTPAHNVIVAFHGRFLDWPFTSEEAIPWPDLPKTMEKRLIVPPNEKIKTSGTHSVDFDVDQIEADHKILCLIGIVGYDDIFGNQQKTQFTGGLPQTIQFLRDGKPMQLQLEGGAFGNVAT